jgi:hypothetical protein
MARMRSAAAAEAYNLVTISAAQSSRERAPVSLHDHEGGETGMSASMMFLALAASSAGPAVAAPTLSTGDSWVYDRRFERGTNGFADRRVVLRIDRVDDDQMLVGIKQDGAPGNFQDHMTGLDWSIRRIIDGKQTVTARPFAFPLTIGKTWTADYTDGQPHGNQQSIRSHTAYRVVGWEDVTVPAGTFHALKIEASGETETRLAHAASQTIISAPGAAAISSNAGSGPTTVDQISHTILYYAPDVRYFVKTIRENYDAGNVLIQRETEELASFSPASAAK